MTVRQQRGFTLIEMMTAVAVIAVLAALGYSNLARQKPRAQLAGAAVEIEALFRSARQNALSTGRDTVVMVFPALANGAGGTGRVFVVEDRSPAGVTFFSDAASVNFVAFATAVTSTTAVISDTILGSYDLPQGITVGLGGAPAPTLDEPYNTILGTVTPAACSFCSTDTTPRGAVVFDSRGRARFYNANETPLAVFGGTIALNGAPRIAGYRLMVITSSTGGVRTFNNG